MSLIKIYNMHVCRYIRAKRMHVTIVSPAAVAAAAAAAAAPAAHPTAPAADAIPEEAWATIACAT